MTERKIRIVMGTNHLEITGIGTVIMNYCKTLDKNIFDLTIIAGEPIADKYEQECRLLGIKLIILPSRHKEPGAHYIGLWKALKRGKYDIFHDHGNSSMMAVELSIAKLVGIKIRIAHSHNSVCSNMKMHRILMPYFKNTYTMALACGQLAGDWLFGKDNFEILPNGFSTEDFVFSKDKRRKVRYDLHIKDEFVIGHVGRLNMQKNQEYLLNIFEIIASKNPKAILLIVGNGPDYHKINDLILNHPYRNRIILYGETNDALSMYSAMDVFVFPSRYEGFPVVLLEAQISGLPCVVSDKVTREVDLGELNWQSIDDAQEKWSDLIMNIKPLTIEQRKQYKELHYKKILTYEIQNTVKQLENIYVELIHGLK